MRKLEWEIIEPDDPRSLENTDPKMAEYIDKWFDYVVALDRMNDRWELWIS